MHGVDQVVGEAVERDLALLGGARCGLPITPDGELLMIEREVEILVALEFASGMPSFFAQALPATPARAPYRPPRVHADQIRVVRQALRRLELARVPARRLLRRPSSTSLIIPM